MHQRSRHNLPTTEQPSGQRSAPKDELSLPVTATKMQTAAMRTRSQVKTGNSNNSKVMDSNPHSGPMLRLRANSADNNYNTAGRAVNVPRQGRPRKTIIRREVTNDHHESTNLFNNYNTISQFYPPRQNSSIHCYTDKFNLFSVVSLERGRRCIGKIRKRQHFIYITPNLYYHICFLPHCLSSYLILT